LAEQQKVLPAVGAAHGGGTSRQSYVIEVAHSSGIMIINGEKYEAQTYCFGFNEGDRVLFIEGSALGACASAELLNLRNKKVCKVWCG